MPRVPTAGTTQGVPFVSQAAPERTLATAQSVGNVFGQVGNLAAEFAERREAQRAREEEGKAFAAFSTELGTLGSDVVRGDEISEITTNFDTGSVAIQKRISEGIKSKRAREVFGEKSLRLITQHRSTVDAAQFKREQSAGRIDLSNIAEASLDSVVKAPTDVIRDELTDNMLDTFDDSELLLAEEKVAAKKKFLERIPIRRVQMLIDLADGSENEVEAIGHLGAAIDMLPDVGDDATRTKLRRQVEAERDDAVQRFNVGLTRAVENDIAAVSNASEAAAIDDRISGLLDDEIILESKAINLDFKLSARVALVAAADTGAERVQGAIASGINLDPKKDQDAFDAYYAERFLPDLQGNDEDEAFDAILALAESTNMIPTTIEDSLRTAANSGDPIITAKAAEQYIAFRDASPQAADRFGESTTILLENINESIVLGTSPQAALARENERLRLDPSILKGRRKAYRDAQGGVFGQTDGEWLVQNRSDFNADKPGFFTLDISLDEEDILPELQEAFAAEVQRIHDIDPDIDKARNRAKRNMQKFWGATAIGGDRMAYLSAELMYPEFLNDSDEIERQAIVDVLGAGIAELAGFTADDLQGRILLRADAKSLRETVDGKLTPGYSLFLLSEDDEVPPFQLLQPNLSPLRFFPEPGEFDESAKQASIAKAKAARERRIREESAKRLAERGAEGAEALIATIPGGVAP